MAAPKKKSFEEMTREEYADFVKRDLQTQREAVLNGDMTEEEYLAYASRYNSADTHEDQVVTGQPAVSSPTSAPSAVDTSYAANLTGGKTQQQIDAEENVEKKYAARAESDPEWVAERKERDKVTQEEAYYNGDLSQESYESYLQQNTPSNGGAAAGDSYAANIPMTQAPVVEEKKEEPVVEQKPTVEEKKEEPAVEQKPTVEEKKEEPAVEQKKEEPVMSYEQYLKDVQTRLDAQNAIYSAQTNYWDSKTAETLKALEEQKAASESYAHNIKQTANAAAAAQKDKIYQSAESQKEMSYAEAEKARERAAVDAESSYAKNLAGYGSNAEKLAAMGMITSGYSDYVNQQAYAQQRAEKQAANAKADESIRYADYEEQQAKTNADLAQIEADAAADLTYQQNIFDIAKSYHADKLGAKQEGDLGKMNATLSYLENLGNSDAENEQKKATLLQMAASGEASGDLIAQLGKLYGLSDAEISQMTEMAGRAADKAAGETKKQQIANLLELAYSGNSSAELLQSLGKLYGLSDAEISEATGIVTQREEQAADEAEQARAEAEQAEIDLLGDDYTASDVDDLDISDEKKAELKQAAYKRVLDQAKASIKENGGQLGDLTDVDEAFQSGNIDEATYKEIYRENAQALASQAKTPDDVLAAIEWFGKHGNKFTAHEEKILQDMYHRVSDTLNHNLYQAAYTSGTSSVGITINGKKYYSVRTGNVSNKLEKMLDHVVPAGDARLTMYDEKLYMRCDDKWQLIKDRDGLYEAYKHYYDLDSKGTSYEKDRTAVAVKDSGYQQK